MAGCVDLPQSQRYINQMAKDLELFKAAMEGVAPLKGGKVPKERPPRPKASPSLEPGKRSLPAAVKRRSPAPRIEAFDRDVDRSLARGRRSPEAALDLHGMTLSAAERAVGQFLAQSSEQGHRVVLIVTGKGMRLEGGRVFGGRIRAEFAGWLERPDNRIRVAGFRPAHPRHGGSGAFYILLRRRTQHA
jgi:DNA-nicking Smr family endonuclease